jgi:transcriptional regulator with XRE-family HTH domain
MDFPLRVSAQLGQHIKSLRKARGLSQTSLGQLIGVGQTRIAEIEANPGLVNLEQLAKLFRALGAELILRSDGPEQASTGAAPQQTKLAQWAKVFRITASELETALATAHAREVAVGIEQPPSRTSPSGGRKTILDFVDFNRAAAELGVQLSPKALRDEVERIHEKSAGTGLHREPHRGSW